MFSALPPPRRDWAIKHLFLLKTDSVTVRSKTKQVEGELGLGKWVGDV